VKRDRHRSLTGARIGIFGKGGAGKSTFAILLARALRRMSYEVALLDADSTNVGISEVLGVVRAPLALIDHFGGMVFGGGKVTCPVDDPTPLEDAELHLDRLAAGLASRSRDGIWLLEVGKIGHRGPGAGCDGPIAKISRDVRIRGNGEDPVTVVDFKAGFEDSARGAITTLDWAFVIVDPTRAAVQMAAEMREMVRQIRSGAPPATRHLTEPHLVETASELFRRSRIKDALCVLNKIPDERTEGVLRERLAEHGIEPIGVIRDRDRVATAWLRGSTIDVDQVGTEMFEVAEKLEATAVGEHRIRSSIG
jgi:CO dehydrogenase maturation factor